MANVLDIGPNEIGGLTQSEIDSLNLNDFQLRMTTKAWGQSQQSKHLDALIYYGFSLWAVQVLPNHSGKDRTIKFFQDAIKDSKEKLQSAMNKNTKESDLPPIEPTPPKDMKDPITKQLLEYDTMVGNDLAKHEMRTKFVFPVIYPKLFMGENNNVILYGPPGTGKTLLAKTSVGQLNKEAHGKVYFNFFNVAADSIRSKWEGGTEKNIKDIFTHAQEHAEKDMKKRGIPVKSVIFLDEIESIALARDKGGDARAVTTLLQQLDGFKALPNVVVLAATNFPWLLDSAFQRRFSKQILLDLPDFKTRAILLVRTVINKYLKFDDFDRLLTFYVVTHESEKDDKWFTKYQIKVTGNLLNQFLFMKTTIKDKEYLIKDKINIREDDSNYTILIRIFTYYIMHDLILPAISKKLTYDPEIFFEEWFQKKENDYMCFSMYILYYSAVTGPSAKNIKEQYTKFFEPGNHALEIAKEQLQQGQYINVPYRQLELFDLNEVLIDNNKIRTNFGSSPSDLTKIVNEMFSKQAVRIIYSYYEQSSDCKISQNESRIDALPGKCFVTKVDSFSESFSTKQDEGTLFSKMNEKDNQEGLFLCKLGSKTEDCYTFFVMEDMDDSTKEFTYSVGTNPGYCKYLQYSSNGGKEPDNICENNDE